MKKLTLLLMFPLALTFSNAQTSDWGNCIGDIWILADLSGSEKGYESYIETSVEIIANGVISSSGSSRVGLISFGDHSTVNSKLTRDYGAFQRSALAFKASGGTNLSGALRSAQREINSAEDINEYKILIIISDGNANKPELVKLTSGFIKRDSKINIISVHVGEKDEKSLLGQISHAYFSSDLVGLPSFFREKFSCI